MPKSTKEKLAVDGTAKLAAKSKASDKHEKTGLSIEEATVASPRASRKRAGEFFDFDDDRDADKADTKAPAKGASDKPNKPAKRAKTNTEDSKKASSKKAKSETKDATDDKEIIEAEGLKTKEPKKTKAKATTAAKDAVASSSGDTVAAPEKSTKKKAKASEGSAKPKSGEKGESETLLEEKAKTPKKSSKAAKEESKDSDKKPATKSKTTKAKKSEEPASKKTKTTTKEADVETGTEPAPIAPDTAMDQTPFKNLLDSDKGTASADTKTKAEGKKPKPSKKKADGEKNSKKAPAKSLKATKEGAEAKPKKVVKHKDSVKVTLTPSEVAKADLPKSKKRKAPISDEAAKSSKATDQLSESATKKQKQSRKSIGESIGELLTSSFEAASGAVRGSLGGLGFGSSADGKTHTISHVQEGKNGNTDMSPAQPADSEASESSDAEPDDQTAALLAGFESDDDQDAPAGSGFTQDQKMPALPNAKKTTKKLKALASAEAGTSQPGVVYVGRVPHGFFEHEMRSYFSQFGEVSRLRLSRSRKTGRSKHYAFIEFANAEVASIVAETMDNYLMFGHILKCKTVAPDDVHASMWKGANKRFKQVPWNKLEGRKLARPVGRDQWKKREEKEQARRDGKAQKMLETVGYSYEGPKLKSVDDLPAKQAGTASDLSALQTQERDLVTSGEGTEEPVVVSEQVKAVKNKKGKGKKGTVAKTL